MRDGDPLSAESPGIRFHSEYQSKGAGKLADNSCLKIMRNSTAVEFRGTAGGIDGAIAFPCE